MLGGVECTYEMAFFVVEFDLSGEVQWCMLYPTQSSSPVQWYVLYPTQSSSNTGSTYYRVDTVGYVHHTYLSI